MEPRFSHLDAATDPLEYVLARNEARRHLDTSQRALIAYELSRESRPGGDRRSDDYQRNADHSANLPNGLTQEQAAARLEVSPRLVRDTGRIMAADRPAAPALRQAVRARRVKISDAKGRWSSRRRSRKRPWPGWRAGRRKPWAGPSAR